MITKPGRYGSAVRRMGEFAKELRQRNLAQIETVDLGGGFPSSILPLTGDDDWTPAPIELYAREIAGALSAAFPADSTPTLLIEAGRGLIDDAAVLVATVIGEKILPSGRVGYLLDVGINALPLATKQRFHVLPLGAAATSEVRPSSLFGPLCLPTDCLAENIPLPHLPRGSLVLFWPVGAYNVTMMTPFIDYRPAVILLDAGNQPRVIRPRDQLGDVVT
jgi:diaminopimelate decarboxylase